MWSALENLTIPTWGLSTKTYVTNSIVKSPGLYFQLALCLLFLGLIISVALKCSLKVVPLYRDGLKRLREGVFYESNQCK